MNTAAKDLRGQFIEAGGAAVLQTVEAAEPFSPPEENKPRQPAAVGFVKRAIDIIVAPELANSLYDPPLIEEVLRIAELMLLVGAAKAKKTFLLMHLVQCVAKGSDFLGVFPCKQGRVLLVDLELPENALRARLSRMLDKEAAAMVDVLSLRDKPELANVDAIEQLLADAAARGEPYILCTIDCLYALEDMQDVNENDNAAMAKVLRKLLAACTRTCCSIVTPHHTGKGIVQERALMDRGRGASSQAGVVDCYASIARDGDGKSLQWEFGVRNFRDPEPAVRVIEFDTSGHPWTFRDTGRAPTSPAKPGAKPKVERTDVLGALTEGAATIDEIVARIRKNNIETSVSAVRRVIEVLQTKGEIIRGTKEREKGKKGPKCVIIFQLPETSPK